MAGHSKWKNIKHKKEKEDAKRGKIFTRLTKEIMVAARDGGGDVAANAKLRMLVEKAKAANMPRENIERAIKKGSGQLEGCNYEQVKYEGYGTCGTAVIIEALTDNKNRTVSELRHYFSRNGGNLAEDGAVSWMFDQKGVLEIEAGDRTEDSLLEILMDCNIDDVKIEDGGIAYVYTNPKELDNVRKQIESLNLNVKSAQIVFVPKELVKFDDPEMEKKAIKFIEGLENLDDVQNIFTNFEVEE